MLTNEQRLKRRNGIGGSDVAAICGLSSYKSPIDIYFQKTLDDLEDVSNDNIWWGNALEEVIVNKYIDTYPQKVLFPDTIEDKEIPFMFANVDGILEDGAVLEAKNVGKFTSSKWGQPYSDDIPVEYFLQVAHYVRICKAPYAHIAAYFGGADFRVYEYRPNKDIENMIVKKCSTFWNDHVLKQVPPPAINYGDQLKLYKDALKDSSKEISSEIFSNLINYKEIQQSIKKLEEEAETIKSSICAFMENDEVLRSADGKTLASWKNQKTCRFDLKKFKNEQNNIYVNYLNEKTSRVLRIG